jgi:ribosome-binding factor A
MFRREAKSQRVHHPQQIIVKEACEKHVSFFLNNHVKIYLMKPKVPKKNTNRMEKVNSLLEHMLAQIIIPYIKDEEGVTSIQKVETSRDLKWAKVWITIVAGKDGKIMSLLRDNIYDIQGEVNQRMETKIVPRISFHLDTTGRYAQHINEIFKQIEDERTADQPDESAE